MSRSVDLFIGTTATLDELAAAMQAKLEVTLAPDAERRRWSLVDGDVTAVLHEHPFVDDHNLPFTRYRYAVSARVSNDNRPQDSAEAASLRRLAQKIQQGPRWPVLLVLDLQFRDAVLHRSPPAPTEAPPSPEGSAPAGVPVPAASESANP